MKILLVVDAQNDFIDGVLGTPEAQAAIPHIQAKVDAALKEGTAIVFTQDTHFKDYMNTREGRFLPVPHCIADTKGWEVADAVDVVGAPHLEKNTFGLHDIVDCLVQYAEKLAPPAPFFTSPFEEIEICGFCTDICVISNALILQSYCAPRNIDIVVDAKACAGVTPEKHAAALEVMKSCQIIVKE